MVFLYAKELIDDPKIIHDIKDEYCIICQAFGKAEKLDAAINLMVKSGWECFSVFSGLAYKATFIHFYAAMRKIKSSIDSEGI